MLLVGLFFLLGNIVNCFTDVEKRQDILKAFNQATADVVSFKAYLTFFANIGDYYVTTNPSFLTVGNNAPFNMIPNSMDLDTALNGFQCQTPSCRAVCQGEGFRYSLSENFTTNGTLFELDQVYESREGVRGMDVFAFSNISNPSSPYYLPNVTFMDSFYVLSKDPLNLSTGNTSIICEVGNGTFGLGRGMKGKMGDTLVSRFIEYGGADVVAFSYAIYTDGFLGTLIFIDQLILETVPYKQYPNLVSEWPLWTLSITDLSLNGISFGANGIGVIDMASTFLRMPTAYADLLAQMLMATPQETPVGRQYNIPNCDLLTLPNITISVYGDLYNITGSVYARFTGGDCLALFMGVDSTYDGTPIWRLGYPFIGVASIFLNYTSNIITLAGPL